MTQEEFKRVLNDIMGIDLPDGTEHTPEYVADAVKKAMDENDRLENALADALRTAEGYKKSYIRDFMGGSSKEEVVEDVVEDVVKEKIKPEDFLDL